jgi:hypothetical protein
VRGEARVVLRADAADFLLNGCQLDVSTNECSAHVSTIMRRDFD